MSSWFIVLDNKVNAYLVGSKLYLTGSDSEKKRNSSVIRLMKSDDKLNIPKKFTLSNEFKIKLGPNLEVQVSNKKLPGGDSIYYDLKNFASPSSYFNGVGKLISQIPNNYGDFGDEIFNLAISDIYDDQAFLVSKKMKEYKDCHEEMVRHLGIEIYSKSRKWEPGHVYYNRQKTIYCLGKLKSRKSDEFKSDFATNLEMSDVYLVTEDIGSEKTISEVLRNKSFGGGKDQIQEYFKTEPMIDGGEVLKNDIGMDFSKYWEVLVDNTIKSNKRKINDYGFYDYRDALSYVLEILTTQSAGYEDYKMTSKKIISDLIKLIKEDILSITASNWLKFCKRDKDVIERSIIDKFYSSISDPNSKRNNFYKTFFNELGINLEQLVKDVLKKWDNGKLKKSSFENYVRYTVGVCSPEYYYIQDIISVDQRTKKSLTYTNNCNSKNLSEVLVGYPELIKVISDIVNSADTDYGSHLANWRIVNNGTYREPKEYVSVNISFLDIIRWFGDIDKVPEKLSSEIINKEFTLIQVFYDFGSSLTV